MPTIRHIIAGLTVGTALAGGLVSLGAITSVTAANATVIPQQFDDGAGLFGLGLGTGLLRRAAATIDAHNADISRTDINSFDRQTAVQPRRQRIDGDGLFGLGLGTTTRVTPRGLGTGLLGAAAAAIDAHNADISRTDINSFDRQTATQRINQRNEEED